MCEKCGCEKHNDSAVKAPETIEQTHHDDRSCCTHSGTSGRNLNENCCDDRKRCCCAEEDD